MIQSLSRKLALVLLAAGLLSVSIRAAETEAAHGKPSILLVHGAFADASSWRHVIPLLEEKNYRVTAIQTPMTSLDDDVKATTRAIEAQPGPVVLVGHSYGGAVISVAAAQTAKVKALVFVAAFAPETGETLGAMQKRYAPPPLVSALVPDTAGFLFVDRAKFHEVFAHDVPAADAGVMAASQRPIFAGIFDTPMPGAGWKSIPSWYVVATEDRAINPELERFMAHRIGAVTTEVKASHVPFLSHPKAIAAVVLEAADAVTRQSTTNTDSRASAPGKTLGVIR